MAQAVRVIKESLARMPDLLARQARWPVNRQNAPKPEVEKSGLKFIEENRGKNFYGEEKPDDKKYFTAVCPDVAVAPVCISCHNGHKDSPRNDFKIGDNMGGVVIRIPIS
jgi:hypothetical protein